MPLSFGRLYMYVEHNLPFKLNRYFVTYRNSIPFIIKSMFRPIAPYNWLQYFLANLSSPCISHSLLPRPFLYPPSSTTTYPSSLHVFHHYALTIIITSNVPASVLPLLPSWLKARNSGLPQPRQCYQTHHDPLLPHTRRQNQAAFSPDTQHQVSCNEMKFSMQMWLHSITTRFPWPYFYVDSCYAHCSLAAPGFLTILSTASPLHTQNCTPDRKMELNYHCDNSWVFLSQYFCPLYCNFVSSWVCEYIF